MYSCTIRKIKSSKFKFESFQIQVLSFFEFGSFLNKNL